MIQNAGEEGMQVAFARCKIGRDNIRIYRIKFRLMTRIF